jgi:hypothetical protein
MLMEIAAPGGNLVLHFGDSVLDGHGVFWPPSRFVSSGAGRNGRASVRDEPTARAGAHAEGGRCDAGLRMPPAAVLTRREAQSTSPPDMMRYALDDRNVAADSI